MDSRQPALFYEEIWDAMAADISALGGPSKVAAWMYPHLGPAAGADMVRACINPHRRERFCPQQTLLLKRKAAEIGSFATITFEAQELGFEPRWITPQDAADELRRAARDLLTVVNQRLDRIERVESRGTAKAGRR